MRPCFWYNKTVNQHQFHKHVRHAQTKFPDTNFLFHTSIGIDPKLPFDLSTCFLLTIFCLGISESNAQDNFAGLFCAFFISILCIPYGTILLPSLPCPAATESIPFSSLNYTLAHYFSQLLTYINSKNSTLRI